MEIQIRKANNKKRKGSERKGSRYWILAVGTMGAVVTFTVGSSRAMHVAFAAERDGRLVIENSGRKPKETADFNIPAGPLSSVIKTFQTQAGIDIKVENEAIFAIYSPGVIGKFAVEEALQKILEGTGVSYAFKAPRVVALNITAEAAVVNVKLPPIPVSTSPKYPEPLRDTPQTINIVTQEVIEQQGATTLRDVLTNVPGITMTAGEGGAPAGDNLSIRGFSARNDIYVDGVRDLGAQSRDPFNLEQVEVVKGPSSTFTGRGSTGGTINLVNKLPNLAKSVSGTLTAGDDSTKRGTIDVNLPVSDTIAFRLNAMGHDSRFAGREDVRYKRWGFAPSVSFGLGTPMRYTASYFYIGQENISDYGIPWVPANNNVLAEYRDRPAPVPRSTFYGYVDRDKEKLRADLLTFRFERDINDNFAVRSQFRYGYSRRDSMATPPRFASANSLVINREMRSWMTNDDIWDNQTDVTAKFKTGSIEHSAIFGGTVSYEKNSRVLRSAPNAQTTLFDPDPHDIYPGVITIDPRRPEAKANSQAAYVFDTVRFNKFLEFVGGLRFDRFAVTGMNTATVNGLPVLVPIDRTDTILSGRASLVFKPLENGSIYASYSTSANPSLEGLLYVPADSKTDPETSRTFELGTKWTFFRDKLLLSSALFRVEKNNARTPSLIPGEPVTLDGKQLVQGIDLSVTGNVTRNWQIIGGYAFLDSEILESNQAPTIIDGVPIFEIGKDLINTPRHSFTLFTTYKWDKLFIGGGPRFVGKRYGNNINTRFVDSYTVVDALISYELSRHIDLRLNMNNIGNKYYIDRIGGGHIIPGLGRSISITTGFRF